MLCTRDCEDRNNPGIHLHEGSRNPDGMGFFTGFGISGALIVLAKFILRIAEWSIW